jgi:hypothetical protein
MPNTFDFEYVEKLEPVVNEFMALIDGTERKYRHIKIKGGRGGGKTVTVARFCVMYCYMNPNTDIPLFRRIKATSRESTKKEIDKAVEYWVKAGVIENGEVSSFNDRLSFINGSSISYKGISDQHHTDEEIKGLETSNTNIIWLEEASYISDSSLTLLRGTIRSKNPLYIYTYNPINAINDPVDLIRGDDVLDIFVTWRDNKWFRDTALYDEMMRDKMTRSVQYYAHTWEGQPYSEDAVMIPTNVIQLCKEFRVIDRLWEKAKVVMGVDTAKGTGGDKSVITIRQGRKLRFCKAYDIPAYNLSNVVIELSQKYNVFMTNIDDSGTSGQALGEHLYLKGYIYNKISFGSTNNVNGTNCLNNRAAMYWRTLKAMEKGIDFTDDYNVLCNETLFELGVQLLDTKKEQIALMPKEHISKLIGHSPDYSDSFALTYAIDYVDDENTASQGTVTRYAEANYRIRNDEFVKYQF